MMAASTFSDPLLVTMILWLALLFDYDSVKLNYLVQGFCNLSSHILVLIGNSRQEENKIKSVNSLY